MFRGIEDQLAFKANNPLNEVREIEVPSREGELSIIVDPERVLVFPAEMAEKAAGSGA